MSEEIERLQTELLVTTDYIVRKSLWDRIQVLVEALPRTPYHVPAPTSTRAVVTLNSVSDLIANKTLAANTTYILGTSLTIDATFSGGFALSSDPGVIFDGTGHTITVQDYPDFPGLFCSHSDMLVQNLTVTSSGTTTLAVGGGWIFREDSTGTAQRCSSTGDMTTLGCGGIFGQGAGGIYSVINGIANAVECYSTGDLKNNSVGGIFGMLAGANNTTATATRCYSTGDVIGGPSAGGIFGAMAGSQGMALADSCYSRGDLGSSEAGGIFGTTPTGYGSGTVTALNCYSSGTRSDPNTGGICGWCQYSGGTISIVNCYVAVDTGNCYTWLGSPTITNSFCDTYWQDSNANQYLLYPPGSQTPVWRSLVINTPYELVWQSPPTPANSFLLLTGDAAIANSGNILLYSADSVITFFETGSFGTDPISYSPGSLFRRTGRRLTKPHEYVFSEVQLVKGATNGGYGGPTGYVCSWAASGSPPGLA